MGTVLRIGADRINVPYDYSWLELVKARDRAPNMGPIWAPAEIGQKTTSFTQSKICAKLMINKRKVLEISGSYGWT